MKNKLIVIGVILLLMAVGSFWNLVESNAEKEVIIENLEAAAKLYADNAKLKSKLNIELTNEKAKIQKDNEDLKDDLSKLKTTPQQVKCDRTPLPAGYFERLLKH